MFTVQLYIIAFIFSLIIVFMLYSVFVFRRKPGDTGEGQYFKGNTPLEITWTIIPLAVVIGMGIWGAGHLTEMTASDPDELVVEVTGFQFGWRFDYPDRGVSSDELYLPLDRQAFLKLTSTDVIHSFWVPEFRLKQDAVPGRWTELRLTPSELGDFRVRCAELCGYEHTGMYAPVVVVEPEQFEAWLAGEEVQAAAVEEMSLADKGKALSQPCLSCHSIDGSQLVGPSWLGLYGSERQLEDGSTAVADEDYLLQSIMDPGSQVVAGYTNLMPPAYSLMAEEDLVAIVEYIKSLSE
jgi:cytochrome c oxidase subunit 2